MHSQRIRQRRRRVTLDNVQGEREASAELESAAPKTAKRKDADGAYTKHARRSKQFKTTDLIPKRFWSVTAVVALLLAAIAGLNLLHLNSPDWVSVIGEDGVAALSLESGRGLGVWYSNFILLLTCCVSLQLYLLRQHRRDDYRGSYRIWMWLAVIFLIASAASVTGISALFRNLCSSLISATSIQSSALAWIVGIKIGGLLILVIRGMIEVRYSRLAVFGLIVVFLSYGGAILLNDIPEVQAQSSNYIHGALGNCLLVGCTALLISVTGFARFVYLEANGLIDAQVVENRKLRKQERSEQKAVRKQEKEAAREAKRQEKELKRLEQAEQKAQAKARKQEATEDAAEKESGSVQSRSSSGKPGSNAEVRKKKKSQSSESAGRKTSRKKQKQQKVAATPRTEERKQEKETATESVEADSPRRKKQKSGSGKASKPVIQPGSADEYLMSVEESEIQNLSKSERRRLRKLKRRTQNRAA